MGKPYYYSDILDVNNEKLNDLFLTEIYALFFFEVRIFINTKFSGFKSTVWNSFYQNGKKSELIARYHVYAKSWNNALKQKGDTVDEVKPTYAISKTLVMRVIKREDIAAIERVESFYYSFWKMLEKASKKYRVAV